MAEVPTIDPDQFAQLIGQASDSQIEEGLAANRELIIGEIFRRMPERLDRERTRDLQAVIEWKIKEGAGGGPEYFQVTIDHGACTVSESRDADPDVRFTIDAVNFIKLIAGAAQGPALFVFGKLKIRGDLMLAARMPGLFTIPGKSS